MYAFVCLFIYSTRLQCDNWRLFLPPCAGSNCGIGKATALGLARRGARVILACRHQGAAEAAAYDIRRVRDTPASPAWSSHHGPISMVLSPRSSHPGPLTMVLSPRSSHHTLAAICLYMVSDRSIMPVYSPVSQVL